MQWERAQKHIDIFGSLKWSDETKNTIYESYRKRPTMIQPPDAEEIKNITVSLILFLEKGLTLVETTTTTTTTTAAALNTRPTPHGCCGASRGL